MKEQKIPQKIDLEINFSLRKYIYFSVFNCFLPDFFHTNNLDHDVVTTVLTDFTVIAIAVLSKAQ